MDSDLRSAELPASVQALLFANRTLKNGTAVSVRLNLNGRVRKGHEAYFVQTVHEGRKVTGRALGYDRAVTVRNASFDVSQRARADIASKRQSKFPMAAVSGEIVQVEPSLIGVAIRFNPVSEHLFVRADDGRAVRFAEEVTVFNTRAYARGVITYWTATDAPMPLEDIPSSAVYTDKKE